MLAAKPKEGKSLC